MNLLFTVIHKRIKEAMDFATMVKLVAKNAFCYVKFIEFLRNPAMLKQRIAKNLEIVQLNIFKKRRGCFFKTQNKPPTQLMKAVFG